MAFETEFGWVLSGSTDGRASQEQVNLQATAFHACAGSGDDILRNFWELEESPSNTPILSVEERTVVRHFEENHRRTVGGRFVVPLPRKADPRPLGESRSQAVQRFLSLERSLNHKNRFQEFEAVMVEYLELGHAEVVLCEDMNKPPSSTCDARGVQEFQYYHQDQSRFLCFFQVTVWCVNLLVGPTVHPPFSEVLLRFRMHRIGLTADVDKMYRVVELAMADRDLHRFVWMSSPGEVLKDYRMTRLTFGVSASSFAANMAVKRNAMDLCHKYPLAAETTMTLMTACQEPTMLILRLNYKSSCRSFSLMAVSSCESGTAAKLQSYGPFHVSCVSLERYTLSPMLRTTPRH